jgi:hypothetical protein
VFEQQVVVCATLHGQPRHGFVAAAAHDQDRGAGQSGQKRVEGSEALEVGQTKVRDDGRDDVLSP